MKFTKKDYIIMIICFLFSLITGILSHDIFIGVITLFTALFNSYLASRGNRLTYLFGLIFCLTYCYASYRNFLFGTALFHLFIFLPLQFIGYFSWKKNANDDSSVIVRDFTLKNSIIITLSCVVGSFVLAYLLSLIPNENIPFLDSASNILNVCANILMILRFKECWWIWIFNNVVDLCIWIIMFLNNGSYSLMMLLVSITYFIINIYGIIKWEIEAKKNKV